MIRESDRVQNALILLAALILIGNHSVQLFGLTIAVLGTLFHYFGIGRLESQGIPQWALYYGPTVGLIEALVFVALGIMLIRRSVRARMVLLWLLPLAVVHDIGYTMVLGAHLSDGAMFFAMDIAAWVALLAYSGRARTIRSAP